MEFVCDFLFGILLFVASSRQAVLLDDQPPKTNHVNVTTDCGQLMGFHNHSYVFRGIPYALPPTGTRRWKEPVPISRESGHCWSGVKAAFTFGNQCVQRNSDNIEVVGSEDCLYLNVWSPNIDPTSRLPVMVYIHGGSLQILNGNFPTYSPTEDLATSTNTVYVSMNYRMSAFGFMALDILSEASPRNTSGNYGFMDQIEALRWVKRNIHNFGGDPNQVTLFGQSSGGTSVFALLASPLMTGLFNKAWLVSGSPILNKTVADASRDNQIFLQNTGCTDVDCLYHLPATKVMDAVPWDVYPYWAMTDQLDLPVKGYFDGAIAVVDGYVLPDPPFVAWEKGNAVDVPLMIGTTAQEIDLDPKPADLKTWTWSHYSEYVTRKLDTFGPNTANEVLKFYPANVETPEYQFTSMASDLRETCPNDRLAVLATKYFKSPVYRYVVTSRPSKPVHPLIFPFASQYSFHLWDIFAFFGTIKSYIDPPSDSDLRFQNNVQREMLSFARYGRPASPEWHTFDTTTMLLSDTLSVTTRYHEQQCEYFINQTDFWSYALIN